MQYVKYTGHPGNMGSFGFVKKGQVLLMTDQEWESVSNSPEFKATRPKEMEPHELIAAQGRELAQMDRDNLVQLGTSMAEQGYPVNILPYENLEQVRAKISRAFTCGPDAFAGEQRDYYDALNGLNDADLIASGQLAGVDPDPKRNTRLEIVAAIVKRKAEFDAQQAEARSEIERLKNAPLSEDTKRRRQAATETLAEVWPLKSMTEKPAAEKPEPEKAQD